MSEQMPRAGAEIIPVVQLHNTVQHCFGDPDDPNVLAAQRQLFAAIMEGACVHQDDPRAIRALQEYTELVDYLWFQPADAPLPKALTLEPVESPGRSRWGQLFLDSELISDEIFARISDGLRPDLQPLLDMRAANAAQHSDRLLAAVLQFAAGTASGRWLQQFNAEQPTGRRLTPGALALRQATIFGEVAAPVKQQYGRVSGPLMRSIPGVAQALNRRFLPLDDEPGHRRVRSPGRHNAQHLVAFVAKQLAPADAVRASYDPKGEALRFYAQDGMETAVYEPDAILELLQQSGLFGYEPTLESDITAADVFTHALSLAYDNIGQGTATDYYGNALRGVAQLRARQLHKGFGLVPECFFDAAGLVKVPPADMPMAYREFGGEGGETIVFNWKDTKRDVRIISYEQEDTGETALGLLLGIRARPPSLEVQISQSCRYLLDEVRRFMSLPEDAPNETVFSRLQTWGRDDPVVWCLGSLYRAADELQCGAQTFSPQTLRELAQALDHVQALQALQGRPDRHDPQGYAAQPALLAAIQRALQPVAAYIQSHRTSA
jgi:hypothetical protein